MRTGSNGQQKEDTSSLVTAIVQAYADAAPGPALSDALKSSLARAIAPHVNGGRSIGLNNAELGSYLGSHITDWEQSHARQPGPRHFTIASDDDVTVAPTPAGGRP